MRKNLLIIVIIAIAAYLVGVEAGRSRGKDYEDLRHQLERLWYSPDAKKARRRLAKRADKAVRRARGALGA